MFHEPEDAMMDDVPEPGEVVIHAGAESIRYETWASDRRTS